MGFDTIIGNGSVVTATDTYVADVAIKDGKIAAIGKDLPRENATKVLEAAGKYVFPGGIDVHTHLDMPFGGTNSADDFESGTRAAAFGGTTTLIDFAIQYKGQPLRKAFDTWMDKASKKAVCDYAFHCIVTDIAGGQLQEMNALVGEGVTPACSCSTMPASSALCKPRLKMADSSVCTRKTEVRSTSSCNRRWRKERRRRSITLSRAPPPPKLRLSRVQLHCRKWQEHRYTLCI